MMPKQSFNLGGWRPSGQVRIRNRLIGSVIEELREYADGSTRWQMPVNSVYGLPPGPAGYMRGFTLWTTGRKRIRNGLFGLVIEMEVMDPGRAPALCWRRIKGVTIDPVELG